MTRNTVSQGKKSGTERVANVKNAFFIPPSQEILLKDKRIILIDDVFTSGATVAECAKTLLAAGAAHVDVLVLAKVVRGGIVKPPKPRCSTGIRIGGGCINT